MTVTADFLYRDGPSRRPSGILLCSPEFMAAYEVETTFYGRNWRRLKREHRKALVLVRRKQRSLPRGIDRSPSGFWRNTEAKP